jgi:hypothetical protein
MALRFVRVQFDFSQEAIARLDALQQEVQSVSRAELIRRALAVYEWLVAKAKKGEAIQLDAEDVRAILGLATRVGDTRTGHELAKAR